MDINILMTRNFHLDTLHWIGAMQPFDPPRAHSLVNQEEKKLVFDQTEKVLCV